MTAKSSKDTFDGKAFEDEKVKILKKNELRHFDRIGSVIGSFALLGVLPEGHDSKISRGTARFFPKSKGDATEAWAPSIFQASALPSIVQSVVHSVDRTWFHDSREDLFFFNEAIPYVANIYPTGSLSLDQDEGKKSQNEIMKVFWENVNRGIQTLQKSYAQELLEPLIAKEKIRVNKAGYQLPLQESLGMTFVKWTEAINGYINQEDTIPRFADIIVKMEVDTGETVSKEKNSNSLVILEEKNQVSSDKANKDKSKQSLISNLLLAVQSLLFKANKNDFNNADAKILLDLRHIIVETITKGNVPKKTRPLSEKVREIWSLKDIQGVNELIEEIRICKSNIQLQSKVSNLNAILDAKSMDYMIAVDEELDEEMTL